MSFSASGQGVSLSGGTADSFDLALYDGQVILAAGTTVLGMIPLLQDNFFVAMAVVIMVGLAFATVLTLVVVPVLYMVFFRVRYQPEK